MMFRKLLQTGEIDVDGHAYVAHYFESIVFLHPWIANHPLNEVVARITALSLPLCPQITQVAYC